MRVPPATLTPQRDALRCVPPGAWLGLLGGGQLGRMFCMAAQSLGYKVAVLDPGERRPGRQRRRPPHSRRLPRSARPGRARGARARRDHRIRERARRRRSSSSRATARVTPAAASVAIAQDRISEKTFLAGHGFAVAPFAVLRSADDARGVDAALLPGIVKSARFGYDGKGQVRVAHARRRRAACRGDARAALRARAAASTLACEVSVIVARNERRRDVRRGRSPRIGIATASSTSRSSRRASPRALAARSARDIATAVAAALDYRGVLCVEMFVAADGALLVNEIAPRPHNSGHYTIDACVDVAVRAAGARARRPAARRHARSTRPR